MSTLKHTQSLIDPHTKLEEVKEEDLVEEETPVVQNQIGSDAILTRKSPNESPVKIPNQKAEHSIITKNLPKESSDLTPEVTTTQDFILKINSIYNQKSRLNAIKFSFILFMIGFFNALNVILNIESHTELTSSLIWIKLRVNFTCSLLLLGIHWFLPLKKIDKYFLAILLVSLNGLIFLNNSLFMHFLFFSDQNFAEAKHSILFERDLRILNLVLILIYYRFEIKTMLLYGNLFMVLLFTVFHSLVYFKLGIWKNYEDYIASYFYIGLILVFIFISRWKNYFIKQEKNLRREAMEGEALKIKEELINVKKKLESTFKTVSRPETASKADEILMKLKYLKFQALVNLKNKITSPNSGKRKMKRNSDFIITDSCGSFSPSKLNKNVQMGDNQQSILKKFCYNENTFFNSHSFAKIGSI